MGPKAALYAHFSFIAQPGRLIVVHIQHELDATARAVLPRAISMATKRGAFVLVELAGDPRRLDARSQAIAAIVKRCSDRTQAKGDPARLRVHSQPDQSFEAHPRRWHWDILVCIPRKGYAELYGYEPWQIYRHELISKDYSIGAGHLWEEWKSIRDHGRFTPETR